MVNSKLVNRTKSSKNIFVTQVECYFNIDKNIPYMWIKYFIYVARIFFS
jgi:hypothetical protein